MPADAPRGPLAATARTVATLGLLQLALPVNLALTSWALLRRAVARPAVTIAERPQTILISGGKMTKALQLARSFHAAGHRVILVETAKYRLTGHRFSASVDQFHVVPDPQSPGYAEALLDIVLREGVDVYVPVCSPLASYYDGLTKTLLEPHCEVMHCDAEMIARLDDKAEFAAMSAELGLQTPETLHLTDASQVGGVAFPPGRSYILKSIPYDPVERLDLTRLPLQSPAATMAFASTKPISESNPWILQEFITGQEYCTHSTVRDGEVQLHCCCESSPFQINYQMVEKPEIEAWVRAFVGAHKLTGQVSFDFIEATDGRLLAIECNPRTHSAITMFYNNPDVATAYLESGVPVVKPLASSRPTYWIYHEIWRLLTLGDRRHRLGVIAAGKDAIFDWSDPLPFLLVHHLHIPSLLLHNLRLRKDWVKIDFNIGKLVEAAGD